MVTLIDGLSLGSIYALIALGYTMVYGIAKMLNFAHGDVIMVGAYAIMLTLSYTVSPLAAVVAAVVLCTILGIVIEKVAYKPLRGASPLAVLITAIGVSYFLQGIAQLMFGSQPIPVGSAWKLPPVPFLNKLGITTSAAVTLICGIIIMVCLTCGHRVRRHASSPDSQKQTPELQAYDPARQIRSRPMRQYQSAWRSPDLHRSAKCQ